VSPPLTCSPEGCRHGDLCGLFTKSTYLEIKSTPNFLIDGTTSVLVRAPNKLDVRNIMLCDPNVPLWRMFNIQRLRPYTVRGNMNSCLSRWSAIFGENGATSTHTVRKRATPKQGSNTPDADKKVYTKLQKPITLLECAAFVGHPHHIEKFLYSYSPRASTGAIQYNLTNLSTQTRISRAHTCTHSTLHILDETKPSFSWLFLVQLSMVLGICLVCVLL